MEANEVWATIVSILGAFIPFLGGAFIWKLTTLFSKKDRAISKAYNSAQDERINSNRELSEVNHTYIKEAISTLRIDLKDVTDILSGFTVELRTSTEVGEKVIEGKDEEIDILREEVSLHRDQVKIERGKAEVDKAATKEMMTNITNRIDFMLNSNPIKKDLLKYQKKTDTRLNEIEIHIEEIKDSDIIKELGRLKQKQEALEGLELPYPEKKKKII